MNDVTFGMGAPAGGVDGIGAPSGRLSGKVKSAARRFHKQRARYYEGMARKMRAGKGSIKPLQFFEKDMERYPGEPRGILAAHWAQAFTNNGANLAGAWEGSLPDDEVAVIRMSQDGASGSLLTALEDVARIARLTDKVRKAVIGTLLAAGFGIALSVFMLTIAPMFAAEHLKGVFGFIPTESWGPKGTALLNHAERVRAYGIAAVIGVILVAVYIQWTVNNLLGPVREWLDTRIGLYTTVRDLKGALFLFAMATLTRKRGNVMMTMRQSLEMFITSVKSPWLRWRIQQIVDKVDDTGAIGSEVFNTNLLSREMFYYLRDTQEERGFAEGFEETGKYIEEALIEEVLMRLKIYRAVLLLIGIVVMAGVAAWVPSVLYEMKGVMQTYFTSR